MPPIRDIGSRGGAGGRQVTLARDSAGLLTGLTVERAGGQQRMISLEELMLRVGALRNISTSYGGLLLKAEGHLESWAVGEPGSRITIRIPSIDALRTPAGQSAGAPEAFLRVLESSERALAVWLSSPDADPRISH